MQTQRVKKSFFVLLATMLVLSFVLAGCGGSSSNGADGSTAANTDSGGSSGGDDGAKKGKTKLKVWYLWGGPEGEALQAVIDRFNQSQDQYEVEGLSVPDEQKVKVAIAGGNGPDVTDTFGWNVSQYADEGIMYPLDDLIAKDNMDMSDFVQAGMQQVTYNGKIYALPLTISFSTLYYNKTLLQEAGYTEPPKTSQELLDVAIKTTKLNPDGSIDVLGMPSYPSDKAMFDALSYSFGGGFVSQDGKTITADNPGNLEALRVIYEYNKKFGVDNVRQVQASGKWLDPNDPFFMGKEALRIDGSWTSTQLVKTGSKVDYGIAPLPYLASDPSTAGGARNSSSIFYIAKNTKNVEGSWAFLKYLYSAPEMASFLSALGNIPATFSGMEQPAFKDVPDFDKYMEFAKNPNVRTETNIAQSNDLGKIITEEVEKVSNLKETPEEGIAAIKERTKDLLK